MVTGNYLNLLCNCGSPVVYSVCFGALHVCVCAGDGESSAVVSYVYMVVFCRVNAQFKSRVC